MILYYIFKIFDQQILFYLQFKKSFLSYIEYFSCTYINSSKQSKCFENYTIYR